MKGEKVLGYADFGAYMHRDDGGKIKVAAYTSVNKPLSIEGNHDETTKIASRRYKIVEEEKAELNGNKFYEKDVWNVQEGGDKSVRGAKDDEPDSEYEMPPKFPESKSETPSALQVLKNFVDNIAADVRDHKFLIYGTLILAVAALVLAIWK